jgi:hypothetical protein
MEGKHEDRRKRKTFSFFYLFVGATQETHWRVKIAGEHYEKWRSLQCQEEDI